MDQNWKLGYRATTPLKIQKTFVEIDNQRTYKKNHKKKTQIK